jgi:cytoskeleton protein RodZ
VADVSNTLREARERAGRRIEDISATTKIRPEFLHAIETGHFETLPGHFFTRTFIKSYARELGLAADIVVAEYDEQNGRAERPRVEPQPATMVMDGQPRDAWRPRSMSMRGGGLQLAAVAGVVLLIAGLANRSQSTAATPTPVGTSGVAAATRPEVQTPPAAAAAGTSAPPPTSLKIEIRPRGVVWVAATADGATAVYKLLQPGQDVTITGREFAFRVGNAAAFDYSINGELGKPVGASGEVREFQINTTNFRTFLR